MTPLSKLYLKAADKKNASISPYRSNLPVICVGNIVVGGSGKTPVVQSLAQLIKDEGKSPVILMRGYGGRLKSPVKIDSTQHTADDVGDEALLHAQNFPTVIALDRAEGARFIEQNVKADIILMDDGFQNPGLEKTLSFVVVDGSKGWGNGCVIPAGPLREPIENGMKRADALVVMGDDQHDIKNCNKHNVLVLSARFVPDETCLKNLQAHKIIAFAGIGHPDKFFKMLHRHGLDVIHTYPFPDHSSYSKNRLDHMFQKASQERARLVTTRKDHMRLPLDYKSKITAIDGDIHWDEPDKLLDLLKKRGLL